MVQVFQSRSKVKVIRSTFFIPIVRSCHIFFPKVSQGSSFGRVVKLLACEARGPGFNSLWKGIRVTMLFDLLTCIMQCCYIQCMIIQCLIFLLQFQFDFITFHFFFLQSCFRAFDICPSFMQDFHCAMRYAILRSIIIHTPSCHYSYFVMPSLLRLC